MGRGEVRRRAAARAASPFTVVVATATLVTVCIATTVMIRYGHLGFFRGGDPRFFRGVARAPFGDGHLVFQAGQPGEAAYRYGRIGLPLAAWVLALGHPDATLWTLPLLSCASVVTLAYAAARYLRERGTDPMRALLVLAVPGVLVTALLVYADAFALTFALAGLVAVRRRHAPAGVVLLGYAVLCREVMAVVVIAVVVEAVVAHRGTATVWLLALVPYAGWAVWVRVRIGELPFLADTLNRRDALGLPFAGIPRALHHGGDAPWGVAAAVLTGIVCLLAGWRVRRTELGIATLLFGVVSLSLGPNALEWLGETMRVLLVAHVLLVLIFVKTARDKARVTARTAALAHA